MGSTLLALPTRWSPSTLLEPLTTRARGCQALGLGEWPHGTGGQVLSDMVQLQPLLGQTQMLLSRPERRTRREGLGVGRAVEPDGEQGWGSLAWCMCCSCRCSRSSCCCISCSRA